RASSIHATTRRPRRRRRPRPASRSARTDGPLTHGRSRRPGAAEMVQAPQGGRQRLAGHPPRRGGGAPRPQRGRENDFLLYAGRLAADRGWTYLFGRTGDHVLAHVPAVPHGSGVPAAGVVG